MGKNLGKSFLTLKLFLPLAEAHFLLAGAFAEKGALDRVSMRECHPRSSAESDRRTIRTERQCDFESAAGVRRSGRKARLRRRNSRDTSGGTLYHL
jgi:hypothetical protein